MKYEKYTPIIAMAFMMLLVQLIAVALSNPLEANDFKAFEDPKDTGNVIVWFALILIFTGFIFLVIKLNKKWMIQAIILISVAWTLIYVFYALFSTPYFFGWDDINGKDSVNFIKFLEQKYGLDWVNKGNIDRIEDGNAVKISFEKNSLVLRLNDQTARLMIDEIQIDELSVKNRDGKLIIYSTIISNFKIFLAFLVSIGLTIALYKFPEWYVIDITGVILGAGSASIFGISLDIVPTLILLVVLLIYDYVAVYQTKHMVALAEGVMDLRLPILLVIPKHWRYSFLSEKFDKEDKEAFFMGLGDAVMPALLVVSANFFVKDAAFYSFPVIGGLNLPAIGAILGTFLGFAVLMTFVMKGKPQAGLPFLNGGVILGYVAGSLIAGSSIFGVYL